MPLVFDRLPEVNEEGSQWTDCELTDTINLVHKNLEKLNSYLSVMVRVAVIYVSWASTLVYSNHHVKRKIIHLKSSLIDFILAFLYK